MLDPYLKGLAHVGASLFHGLTCMLGSYTLGKWLEQEYPGVAPWQHISVFVGLGAAMFGLVWFMLKINDIDKQSREKKND